MPRLIDADALRKRFDDDVPIRPISMTYNKEDVIRAVLDAPTVGGWISVKDKTPEDGVEVLVWDDGGFAYIDTWIGHTWKFGGDFGVTHWMPLPEPPEEVSGDG